MPYVGREIVKGQNRELDDISSSFNSGNTAFTMQVGGVATSAGSVNQVFISLGGVMQHPGTDYTVSSSTLTFTTAPASGLAFWGLIQGNQVDTGIPSDGTVGSSKFASGDLTFPSDITIPDKIIHTGDTNTSIRFPAADTITAETSGSERLRIASTGRVAIGNATNNASPTALFDVKADDGEAANLYISKFTNLEATAGESFGVNIQAGSSTADHGFRVKNRANDATQLLVRGDGKIGIGEDAPNSLLHLGAADNSNHEAILSLNNGGATGNEAGIEWLYEASTTPRAKIWVDSSGQDLKFATADTLRFTIGSDGVAHFAGDVKVLTGDLIMGSGRGVNFAATANGPSMDSEVLDDYEEGTWTPTLLAHDGSSWGNVTLDAGNLYAKYTKVGNLVHIQVYAYNFHVNSAHDADLAAFTLPFTVFNGMNGYGILCSAHFTCFETAGQTNFYAQGNTTRAGSVVEGSTAYNTWSGTSGRYLMVGGSYIVA